MFAMNNLISPIVCGFICSRDCHVKFTRVIIMKFGVLQYLYTRFENLEEKQHLPHLKLGKYKNKNMFSFKRQMLQNLFDCKFMLVYSMLIYTCNTVNKDNLFGYFLKKCEQMISWLIDLYLVYNRIRHESVNLILY